MDRIPEPALTDDPAQAPAYARADFAHSYKQFVAQLRQCFPGRHLIAHGRRPQP